jgi:hypothetical protein
MWMGEETVTKNLGLGSAVVPGFGELCPGGRTTGVRRVRSSLIAHPPRSCSEVSRGVTEEQASGSATSKGQPLDVFPLFKPVVTPSRPA